MVLCNEISDRSILYQKCLSEIHNKLNCVRWEVDTLEKNEKPELAKKTKYSTTAAWVWHIRAMPVTSNLTIFSTPLYHVFCWGVTKVSRRGRSSGNHNVTESFTRRQSGRPTRSQCTFTFDYLTLWTVAGRGSEQLASDEHERWRQIKLN